MKTGLLTFYHIHHYGAALQAAALTRETEALGADCQIIDYYVRQDNSLFRVPSTPAAAVSDLHTVLHYASLRRRWKRFEAFRQAHLHLTDRRFLTLDELRAADPVCDVLLCGSDQIWNPTIFPDGQFDPVFFGAFSPARKAAYAPSFGISQIPEEMKPDLRQYLASFSHLSARERAGQSILLDLTGREAALVLDPTLLPDASDWETLSRYPKGYPEGTYILCYCISRPEVLSPYIRALARKTGLPVVQLCGIRRRVVPGARCVLDAGPAEFLGLFQHAAAVITNSFHGTAFSIQFRKPFFSAVSPRELADPSNARTYGLLQRLGLSDRIAGTGRTASIDAEIDWESVEGLLRAEREKSRAYLSAALSGEAYASPSQTPEDAKSPPAQTADEKPTPAQAKDRNATPTRTKDEKPTPVQAKDGKATPTRTKDEKPTPIQVKDGNAPPAQTEKRKPAPIQEGNGRASASRKDRPALPVLASWEACTGCTACFNVCPRNAITMERDSEGFSRPVIAPAVCVRCGRCTKACPALRRQERLVPAPAVYAAWNRDEAVRRASSSGGVFSALAEHVLRAGGMVFGAALDSRHRVSHTACFRVEELEKLRGAKYVQSDLRETFRMVQWTLAKRPVLFSGTPCQVDGLYHFLGERPDNLLTCDLVCHGVPSPGVWEDMVRAWGKERQSDVAAVRFRDKAQGVATGSLSVTWENGVTDIRPLYETEYGRAFGRSILLRPCCFRCPYANLDRVGDFTLGDFWGLREDEFPEEQRKGVSLLLVNTRKASRVFDDLPIERHSFPAERAVEGNPNLSRPTACPPDRAEFFAAYALEPFEDVRRRYLTVPPAIARTAKKLLSPVLEAVRKRR